MVVRINSACTSYYQAYPALRYHIKFQKLFQTMGFPIISALPPSLA